LDNEEAIRVLTHAMHMVRVRPDGEDRDVARYLLELAGYRVELAQIESQRKQLQANHRRVFGDPK
jgi:hypothetical protein